MFELPYSRKFILTLMTGAVVAMLVTSFTVRLSNNPNAPQTVQSAAQSKADALSEEIGRHMEELKSDPNNYATLVHTADLLIQTEQWAGAESFLRRAVAIDSSKGHPYYLLGIALHSQNRNEEAAAALEKVASIDNDASARYSLAVLYMYFLNNAPKGLEHLEKALATPKLPTDLKASLEDERKKALEAIAKAKANTPAQKQEEKSVENEAKETAPVSEKSTTSETKTVE